MTPAASAAPACKLCRIAAHKRRSIEKRSNGIRFWKCPDSCFVFECAEDVAGILYGINLVCFEASEGVNALLKKHPECVYADTDTGPWYTGAVLAELHRWCGARTLITKNLPQEQCHDCYFGEHFLSGSVRPRTKQDGSKFFVCPSSVTLFTKIPEADVKAFAEHMKRCYGDLNYPKHKYEEKDEFWISEDAYKHLYVSWKARRTPPAAAASTSQALVVIPPAHAVAQASDLVEVVDLIGPCPTPEGRCEHLGFTKHQNPINPTTDAKGVVAYLDPATRHVFSNATKIVADAPSSETDHRLRRFEDNQIFRSLKDDKKAAVYIDDQGNHWYSEALTRELQQWIAFREVKTSLEKGSATAFGHAAAYLEARTGGQAEAAGGVRHPDGTTEFAMTNQFAAILDRLTQNEAKMLSMIEADRHAIAGVASEVRTQGTRLDAVEAAVKPEICHSKKCSPDVSKADEPLAHVMFPGGTHLTLAIAERLVVAAKQGDFDKSQATEFLKEVVPASAETVSVVYSYWGGSHRHPQHVKGLIASVINITYKIGSAHYLPLRATHEIYLRAQRWIMARYGNKPWYQALYKDMPPPFTQEIQQCAFAIAHTPQPPPSPVCSTSSSSTGGSKRSASSLSTSLMLPLAETCLSDETTEDDETELEGESEKPKKKARKDA
jgi:hypothetical protein